MTLHTFYAIISSIYNYNLTIIYSYTFVDNS
uniref:Uncharacterized protein n=1 Tax=Siphoviridae sp. ct37J14 TaxID=2826280 RepID=A0A8S5M0V9_9CAUD|nr:MAG TPA: hypothetical protein [Siphoviridae sp. ct37J14]